MILELFWQLPEPKLFRRFQSELKTLSILMQNFSMRGVLNIRLEVFSTSYFENFWRWSALTGGLPAFAILLSCVGLVLGSMLILLYSRRVSIWDMVAFAIPGGNSTFCPSHSGGIRRKFGTGAAWPQRGAGSGSGHGSNPRERTG